MKTLRKIAAVLIATALLTLPAYAGVSGKKMEDGSINAAKLSEQVRTRVYAYERFDAQPLCFLTSTGYSDPTSGGPNTCQYRGGLSATYTGLGTQTLLSPVYDATKGLDISQDQTDNDGVQYTFGSLGVEGPFTYTVGTDSAFIKIKFRIADVSGTDDCAVGFRKNEAVQANIDDYDEAAFVNVILGAVKVETILNNAATITTDSGQTWADDATHTIEVQLKGRRVVTLFDGAPLAGIPEYNFDNAEVVVPFFFFLQATTTPGKVWWKTIEIGRLSAVDSNAGDDPL